MIGDARPGAGVGCRVSSGGCCVTRRGAKARAQRARRKSRRGRRRTPRRGLSIPKRARWIAAIVLASVALLAAGGYGAWRVAHWLRDRRIRRRVESYDEIIRRYARANDLPVALVQAVIRAESAGDARAVSNKNAKGLMQITPITEEELLRRLKIPPGDLFDPDYNVRLGTAYLRILTDRFGGDLYLALAAYHMGPTRLDRIRKAHPGLSGRQLIDEHVFPLTRRYCRTILQGLPKTLAVSKR